MAKFLTKLRPKKAFALIEIMLAVFIFTLFSTGVLYLSLDVIQRDAKLPTTNEALLYAQEGIEASRNIRDQNFLLLETGDHGLSRLSGAWEFENTSETIDSYYTRTVTVEDVYRDAYGEITSAGGTLDPDMKKVASEVEWDWKDIFPKSITLTTYLSGWTGTEWIQTTCSDFNAGYFTDISAEITPAPPADNCALKMEITENLNPFFTSVDIGDHGDDVVVDGDYAYVATKKTSKGLTVVDISDPASPLIIQQLNIGGKGRYVTKDGDYLYMGVQKGSEGLAIVNVATIGAAYVVEQEDVDTYGNKADYSGDYLFMGTNQASDSFVVLDISDKSDPDDVTELSVGGEVNYVHVNGNYAYLAVEKSSKGFQVVDISDPENPSVVATLNVGDSAASVDTYGSFAYVGTRSTSNSIRVIDISNPLSPVEIASVNPGSAVEDLKYAGSFVYAAMDDTNRGMVIVDVSNPLSPTISDQVDITGKGSGVAVDGEYVYLGVQTNNRGLVILGAYEKGYATSGTYTSDTLNTGSADTRFNYIEWDAYITTDSSITLQIRTASSQSGLSSATWVGPDGTNGTYYDTSRTEIVLDPGASGSQYLQFQAYMTSNGVSSPSIESVTVNYTP